MHQIRSLFRQSPPTGKDLRKKRSISLESTDSTLDESFPVIEHVLTAQTEDDEDLKHVSFSNVSTRLYPRILGDNPCSMLPLSIDWSYIQLPDEPVREDTLDVNTPSTCAQTYEPLSTHERQVLLHQHGYSRRRLAALERQRRMTLLLEWDYRSSPEPFPNALLWLKRYVLA